MSVFFFTQKVLREILFVDFIEDALRKDKLWNSVSVANSFLSRFVFVELVIR